MAVCGELRVSATMGSYPFKHNLRSSLPPSKVGYKDFTSGGFTACGVLTKGPLINLEGKSTKCHYQQSIGITGDNELFPGPVSQETEGFLLSAINMSFFERLNLAWKILFPSPTTRSSNANIAKQRLKMILFSDRCAVTDEAKQKIVSNVVGALSDFVEIDSEDKVQLSVSTDPDLGTMYSVTVPVRRVKPEYQDEDDIEAITNINYNDTGETSGSVDVKFDFFIPDEKSR